MSEMVMERIRENLDALKMKHTLEILDNYLERAVKDDLNVIEVLDHILTEESRHKRKRAIETQIMTSGFPMRKELEDFDFKFQPSIDKRQIDELATMRFLENGENVVFLGPLGVGKTHLATAYRRSTYYINCHSLIEQLKKLITKTGSQPSLQFSANINSCYVVTFVKYLFKNHYTFILLLPKCLKA